jgi:hypothetical protein
MLMFGRRKDKNKTDITAPVESAQPDVHAADPGEDAALIAVIAAAVAAYLGTSQNGIVIRSLRRSASSTPEWGREGRAQQLYQQF